MIYDPAGRYENWLSVLEIPDGGLTVYDVIQCVIVP